MSASTEPTGDGELLRLLNVYALALYQTGVGGVGDQTGTIVDARAALLAHIAQQYVRRVAFDAPDEDRLSALSERHESGEELTPAEVAEWRALVDRQYDACHARAMDRIRAARGVLPRRPGDELPEDAIRRLRDGE